MTRPEENPLTKSLFNHTQSEILKLQLEIASLSEEVNEVQNLTGILDQYNTRLNALEAQMLPVVGTPVPSG